MLFSTALSDGGLARNQRLRWWYASPRNGHISLFSHRSVGYPTEPARVLAQGPTVGRRPWQAGLTLHVAMAHRAGASSYDTKRSRSARSLWPEIHPV